MRILLLAMLLFQAPTDDPHVGQPETCNNYRNNTHKCECHRATECPNGKSKPEDTKCQVYCRKDACKCLSPCTSHNHSPDRRGRVTGLAGSPKALHLYAMQKGKSCDERGLDSQ